MVSGCLYQIQTVVYNGFLLVNVHMPKDRVTQMHQGYGFVEFLSEEDADYAIKIMNMIKLYGKPIRVNKASAHQKNLDVGANIFIGNLDPEVDEKLLYDTFSAFGVILQTPKVQSYHFDFIRAKETNLFPINRLCVTLKLVTPKVLLSLTLPVSKRPMRLWMP